MAAKGSLTVEGLQNPVVVCQLDETRVELFISYSVALNWSE
jgi:hypothetical protein